MTGLSALDVEAWFHGRRAAARAARKPSPQVERLRRVIFHRAWNAEYDRQAERDAYERSLE